MESYSPSTDPGDNSLLPPDGTIPDTSYLLSPDAAQSSPRHSLVYTTGYASSISTAHSRPQSSDAVKPSSSKLTHTPEKRIPRPRNAFMIFRSAFWAEQKINSAVERDHRHISRIIGHCWNRMSEQEKDKWRAKAHQEKDEHSKKHPGYVFSPTPRTKKPVRRKVKRNGPDDIKRCEAVADLLLMGKQGEDLAEAIKANKTLSTFEGEDPSTSPSSNSSRSSTGYWSGSDFSGSDFEDPPFRSPLLPPSSLHPTPVATSSSLSLGQSPMMETFSTAHSPPSLSPEHPHMMTVDQATVAQHLESTLFQILAVPSPAPSSHELEGLEKYFTQTVTSFDTLDSVGYHMARSATPGADFCAISAQYPLFDATTVPPVPPTKSSYDLSMLPPPSPSPEPDYYTASTRLPGVDGSTIGSLPVADTPARVITEPVHFKDPFPSADP